MTKNNLHTAMKIFREQERCIDWLWAINLRTICTFLTDNGFKFFPFSQNFSQVLKSHCYSHQLDYKKYNFQLKMIFWITIDDNWSLSRRKVQISIFHTPEFLIVLTNNPKAHFWPIFQIKFFHVFDPV